MHTFIEAPPLPLRAPRESLYTTENTRVIPNANTEKKDLLERLRDIARSASRMTQPEKKMGKL
jgi:hypothetical protein